MNKQHIFERLRSFAETKKRIRITRFMKKDPKHYGHILGLGMDWVALHQYRDFFSEGCTAIRLKDIRDIRYDEHDQFWDYMLNSEGDAEQFNIDDLELNRISELLRGLHNRGKNIIVEREKKNPEGNFYIGQIVSISECSVCFAGFDTLGKWYDSVDTIPFEHITQIQFDTPYTRNYSKYLKGPMPWKQS
jgi:hypothetical protein